MRWPTSTEACSERASVGRELTDLLGEEVGTLGHNLRSGFFGVVLERNREMRRVRDNDVGGRDVGHHARAGRLDLAAADRALDLGGQLLSLALLLDLLLVHLQRLLVAVALV